MILPDLLVLQLVLLVLCVMALFLGAYHFAVGAVSNITALLPQDDFTSLLMTHARSQIKDLLYAYLQKRLPYTIGLIILVSLGLQFLQWPFDWLLGSGFWVDLLIAGIMFYLGWRRVDLVTPVAISMVLAFGLWRPEQQILFWLAGPALLGSIIQQVGMLVDSRGQWLEQAVQKELLQQQKYGKLVVLPGFLDYALPCLSLAIGAIPLLVVLRHALGAPADTMILMRMLGGLMVFVTSVFLVRSSDSVPRYHRRLVYMQDLAYCWLIIVITWSPVGIGLARVLATIGPWLFVAVISALLVATQAMLMRLKHNVVVPFARAVLFVSGVIGVLFTYKGLFLFLVFGLLSVHPGFIVVGIAVAMLNLLVRQALHDLLIDAAIDQASQGSVLGRSIDLWGPWLYDAFWARPTKPDFRLLHELQFLVAVNSNSEYVITQVLIERGREAKRSQALAQQWIALAEEGFALIMSQVVPRWPYAQQERFQQLVRRENIRLLLTKATLSVYLNYREEAVDLYRQAIILLQQLGLLNLAAYFRGIIAQNHAIMGQHSEAKSEIARALDDTSLSAITRRLVLDNAILCAGARRDYQAMLDFWEQRNQIRVSPTRYWRFAQEAHTLGLSVSILSFAISLLVYAKSFAALESQLDAFVNLAISKPIIPWKSLPFLDNEARRLLAKGVRLLSTGKLEKAQQVLAKAAAQAEQAGYVNVTGLARYLLVDAMYRRGDLLGAYRNLVSVLDHEELFRHRVLLPEARIDIGSVAPDPYPLMISILLSKQARGAGWPDKPVAKALHHVEQSRSRVFLEILGEHLEITPPPTLAVLRGREQAALSRYRAALTALVSPASTQQIAALREAIAALDMVWAEMERYSNDGAAYVSVRRGSLLTFDELRTMLSGEPASADIRALLLSSSGTPFPNTGTLERINERP